MDKITWSKLTADEKWEAYLEAETRAYAYGQALALIGGSREETGSPKVSVTLDPTFDQRIVELIGRTAPTVE